MDGKKSDNRQARRRAAADRSPHSTGSGIQYQGCISPPNARHGFLYQTALIAVLYIERDCVIDESKKAFLLLLQWSWYSKIRGRSLLGLCSTKKINGIWSKIFHFGYSIFVTDFMGLLLHPVYVFWCISAYFNGYIDLKRDNGVTPPNVSGWFKIKMAASHS